jgi:OLD-like protein/putative AbiEii toxin of type IV toxin-antitoxin system
MKESECHGLKELITLLAFLYDDDFNALIIDEPELHLHPQFQTFLLAEIRRMAGDPRVQAGSKVFFLITHSPYLLDFRVINDLRQCLIFHADELPTCIGTLTPQDEYSLKRLLPRLNTHHKQFFFAHRPIFVEGYTDQQLFTLIQDSRGKLLGASGACFIDVNGKDEQDFYFRLCRQLKIDAQFISDLDVLTRGNFRNSISEDTRSKEFVTTQGIGTDWMDAVRELYKRLDTLITAINASTAPDLADIKTAIQQATNTDSKRYRGLIAAIHHRDSLRAHLPAQTGEIDYIVAKVERISEAAQKAGTYLLPKGALENHLPSYAGSIYQPPESAKASIFEQERDFILSGPGLAAIESRYSDLIPILDSTSGACEVNLKRYVGYAIGVFIGNVQVAFERGEIDSLDSFKQHASVDWATNGRILDTVSFVTSAGGFTRRMKLKQIVDPNETEFEFTDETVHSKFTLA